MATPNPETIQVFQSDSRLRWSGELHRFKGDVLFADGHVELWNQLALAANLRGRNDVAELVLPSVNGNAHQWANNPGQPAARPQPVNEETPNDPNNGNAGSTTLARRPESAATVFQRSPAITEPPRMTEIKTMEPAAGDTPPRPASTVADGGGKGGVFPAFIISNWWFWLCLLIAVCLAQAWWRMTKNKPAGPDAEQEKSGQW